MQNINSNGYKKPSNFSIIMPSLLDNSNTKYTYSQVLAAWGFLNFVEPKESKNPNDNSQREVLSMPKGWKSEVMGYSGWCLIFDKKKRVRARFRFDNLQSPLCIVPAITSTVDYDTHILGEFGKSPRGLVGVVKLGNKIIYSTQTVPYRMRTNQWGSESQESAKEREATTAHLKNLCAKYIQLHYPDTDAMAYWD